MSKIWIYGLDEDNDVVRTTWRLNEVTDDAMLNRIADFWKANYGCTRVFAMIDSKQLQDSWFVYLKTRGNRHGLAEPAKTEFIDYLESGDWRL